LWQHDDRTINSVYSTIYHFTLAGYAVQSGYCFGDTSLSVCLCVFLCVCLSVCLGKD